MTLDLLVDHVYNYFKTNYVVGETVDCNHEGRRVPGLITALVSSANDIIDVEEGAGYVFEDRKVKGNRLAEPKAYRVKVPGNSENINIQNGNGIGAEYVASLEIMVTPDALNRKKTPYSKPMIRQKIKQVTLPREHYPDAHWMLHPQVFSLLFFAIMNPFRNLSI